MHNRKRIKIAAGITVIFMAFFSIAGFAVHIENTYADSGNIATDSFTVKAGFYGGPYYEVKTYSDADMRAIADGTVWTYTGVDGGDFMRVCYAWGVPLDVLLSDADIDLGSVNYLHFGTKDSYGESVSTFKADKLLEDRYFFPNIVNAAGNISGDRVTIDYSRVDSDVTSNAARVPTLLAIGSSEFSRIEMRNIVETRTYPEKSASSLDEGHKYRLIYGQKGLDSTDSACNVQTSDKWSYEMNVQLSGSPEIVVDKELISGENGKKGSKYQISVRINFPDSYGYLDSETLSKLEKQVLDDLECEYSESNVKLDKKGSGQYELEVISEGETDLNFKYSRNEYGGGKTTASGQTTIESPDSSSDDGTGTGSGDGSGSGSGDGSGSGGSGKTDPGSGNTGGKDDDGSGSSIKNPNSGSSDRNKGNYKQ